MAQLDQTISPSLLQGKLPQHLTLQQAWLQESLSLAVAMQKGPFPVPPDLQPLYKELRLLMMRAPRHAM